MAEQHLDQYVVDDYIRETRILTKVQTGLNMAIEKGIKSPESFLADYLLQGVIAQKNGILIENIHLNSRGQILYTINYLNVLRTLSFQLEPEIVQKISEKPVSAPTRVLEQLNGLDLSLQFSELCEAVKAVLEESYDIIVQHFIDIISCVLRKPKFDALLHSLRLDKQLYKLPRLIIGVLESPLMKFQVIQTVQKTYEGVLESYEALSQFLQQIESQKTLCQLAANEKTGELSVQGLSFEFSDVILRDRDQTIEYLAEKELNKDIRMQPVARPESAKGGKGAKGASAAPQLTNAQVQVLLARNVAKMLQNYSKYLGVFVTVDLSKLTEQKICFSGAERCLYLTLLNVLMEFCCDSFVYLQNYDKLPQEVEVRPGSGKGGKGGKNAPQGAEEVELKCYNTTEVLIDVSKALKDLQEVRGVCVSVFGDKGMQEGVEVKGLKMIKFGDAGVQLCAAGTQNQLFGKLASLGKEEVKAEASPEGTKAEAEASPGPTATSASDVASHSSPGVKKEMGVEQGIGVVLTFTLEEEGERPVSGKGGKAPKGGGKGGKEVEKVEKSKLISYGEAAIIEGKEFVYFDDKGDIDDFCAGIWQLVTEKRAVVGI